MESHSQRTPRQPTTPVAVQQDQLGGAASWSSRAAVFNTFSVDLYIHYKGYLL